MCVVVHADLGPVGLLDVTTFPDPSENAQNPETVHESGRPGHCRVHRLSRGERITFGIGGDAQIDGWAGDRGE
jgi:hypothetical protein